MAFSPCRCRLQSEQQSPTLLGLSSPLPATVHAAFSSHVSIAKRAWLLQALALSGRPIGNFSLRVRPSKTAIVPVNNGYLPRTEEEHALCARTVYAANIGTSSPCSLPVALLSARSDACCADKRLDKSKVRQIFENLCGASSECPILLSSAVPGHNADWVCVGPVSRLRLLGDSHHATRIAFVEFCKAESAEIALKCSGALLGGCRSADWSRLAV